MWQWKWVRYSAAAIAALVGAAGARADLIPAAGRGQNDPPALHSTSPDRPDFRPVDSDRASFNGREIDTGGHKYQPMRIDDSSGFAVPTVVSHPPERGLQSDPSSTGDPRPITLQPVPTHLVPEPASFGLIGIASAFLLYRKPRR